MSDGTVQWFNPRSGYGYIETSDGQDVLLHYEKNSENGGETLKEGDAVNFDIVKSEKGLWAGNVALQTTS